MARYVEDYSTYRNVTIESYLDAVRDLTAHGYTVVRVGDKSMTSLPALGPAVVDLPFVAQYDPLLELYLFEKCIFMIACRSGPCSLAQLFARPILLVNSLPEALPEYCFGPLQVTTFKKFYRVEGKSRHYLSLRDVLELKIDGFIGSADYERQGLVIENMNAAEILSACQEMLAIIEGRATTETAEQRRFVEICRTVRHARSEAGDILPRSDLIAVESDRFKISASFCRHNPNFLQ